MPFPMVNHLLYCCLELNIVGEASGTGHGFNTQSFTLMQLHKPLLKASQKGYQCFRITQVVIQFLPSLEREKRSGWGHLLIII